MINHYKKCITLLQNLQKKYPKQTLGHHLSMALSEYGDIWSITDKEMLFALEKYETEKELDFSEDIDINKIIFEGEHLFDDLPNEDEDGY
jgi:hypothetical protein